MQQIHTGHPGSRLTRLLLWFEVVLLPVVVHLVDDEDLVADLLLAEERVNEGNKHQQLLKALSEGDDDSKFVRPPGWVVRRRRLTAGRAGRRRLLRRTSLSVHGGHITRTAELQPEQRDKHQQHAEAEQLVDGAFTGQKPETEDGGAAIKDSI